MQQQAKGRPPLSPRRLSQPPAGQRSPAAMAANTTIMQTARLAQLAFSTPACVPADDVFLFTEAVVCNMVPQGYPN